MSTAPSLKSDNLTFTLEIVKGPHAGTQLEFDKSSVTMGRGPENDIVLANDPRVSRQHVELKQSLGQFYLVNLSQKNFVLVNGSNAITEKIESKSTIQLGDTEMVFRIQGATSLLEPVQPGSFSMPLARAGVPPAPAPSPLTAVPNPVPAMPPRPAPAGPVGFPQAAPPMPHQAMPPAYGHPPQPYNGAWQPPGSPPPRGPVGGESPFAGMLANKRVRIYGAIVLFGLLFVFMMQGGRQQKVDDKPFRTSEEMSLSRQESENEIKAFQERREKMAATVYQEASKNFLRGYRDYRQGQYARAREAFQVVLNLDPENELAKRYHNLSKIRFDEQVKFNMLQGRRYLETQNYRLCRSSFKTVMTMLGGDQANPEYKEAMTLHKQCDVAAESRY